MNAIFFHNVLFKIILIILNLYLSYKVLKYCVPLERDLYKYKIKYFTLNFLVSLSYICFSIIFIFIFRTRVLDKEINLYLLYSKSNALILTLNIVNSFLVILTIISIIIFITILIKEINEKFINQVIKRYLYTFFGTKKGSILEKNVIDISLKKIYQQLFIIILHIFNDIGKISYITNKGKDPYKYLYNICEFIVMKLPTICICLYFLYELKYNHGILTPKFNSWFFLYVLFSLYKRITNYIVHSECTINEMVFNMYYRDRSIKYVNMPTIWENVVYKYVDDGLSFNSRINYENFSNHINIITFYDGIFWKYTWSSQDGYIYTNNNNEQFEEENNHSLDVVHYPYLANDINFNKNINDTYNTVNKDAK